MRKIAVNVVMYQDEDGVWIAECPAIPGCVSQGDSRKSALANLREAAELCIEVRVSQGLPMTLETTEIEIAA